ncbi:topoisomerase C-terminal repeat-containing protein (plasmid) [Mycoplasmatota bacterium]|nr:topoisomerase C-terminal repeat-containing protein [Mycoplasmatota bacterium]
MAKKLIICEKPSVAKQVVTHPNLTNTKRFKLNDNFAYGYYENNEFIVSWAFGHLFEFKKWDEVNSIYAFPFDFNLLPVLENVKYKIKKSEKINYKFQLALLKKLMDRDDVIEIINACDFDKEGEVIFKLIYTFYSGTLPKGVKPKPISRLILNSYDKKSLVEAFNNIDNINDYRGLEEAGKFRSKMDYYLGDTLTRCLTVKLGNNQKWLSSGRVQLAILYELYKRESMIKNFKSHNYYGVTVKSSIGDIVMKIDQNKNYILDQEYVQNIANNINTCGYLTVADVIQNKEYKNPPKLFSTTDLYYYMNQKHNMSLEQTQKILQKELYEKGYITYPRTDSNYLNQSQKMSVLETYKKYTGDTIDEKTFFASKNFNDELVSSHHAIIPTLSEFEYGKNAKADLVYITIKERFIQSFMASAIAEKRHYIFHDQLGHEFEIKEEIIIEKGWLAESKDVVSKTKFTLPVVNKGDLIPVESSNVTKHKTKTPSRYTTASILNFMKNPLEKKEGEYEESLVKGFRIGTPATEHTFIPALERNELIEIKKRAIYLTSKGWYMMEKTKLELYKTPEFTANMELELNKLNNNFNEQYLKKLESQIEDHCYNIVNEFRDLEQQLIEVKLEDLGYCPKCKSHLKKLQKAYVCINRDCDFYIPKYICDKLITEKIVGQILTLKPTSLIKGFKSKKDTKFSARLKYNMETNRINFIFDNNKKNN